MGVRPFGNVSALSTLTDSMVRNGGTIAWLESRHADMMHNYIQAGRAGQTPISCYKREGIDMCNGNVECIVGDVVQRLVCGIHPNLVIPLGFAPKMPVCSNNRSVAPIIGRRTGLSLTHYIGSASIVRLRASLKSSLCFAHWSKASLSSGEGGNT